jgi:hypothetical protein
MIASGLPGEGQCRGSCHWNVVEAVAQGSGPLNKHT